MAIQARTEFAAALNQIASEKGVDVNVVVEAIETAALAAYKKDSSLRGEEIAEDVDDLVARIDPASGEISIMKGKKDVTPPGFARIAAQTAKQVIMQKLNEAEKGAIMEEYEKKVGTVVSATIQRQEGNMYFVDLGRAEGILPPPEQTRDEYYHLNQRLKVYIKEIREGHRGPEVVVSRSDPKLVEGLFQTEVPELQAGSVIVKAIAREAGGRTKIAAISTQEGVDPVGSLVGQKGVRVQAVLQELGEEKIDIVTFSEDPARFIAAALSPAKDLLVTFEEVEGEKVAKVRVPSTQLSLAIGKGGQNVRLAAKITGYKIDIVGDESEVEESVKGEVGGEKVDEEAGGEKAEEKTEATGETVEEKGTAEKEVKADDAQPADDRTAAPADDGEQKTDKTKAEGEIASSPEAPRNDDEQVESLPDSPDLPDKETPVEEPVAEEAKKEE